MNDEVKIIYYQIYLSILLIIGVIVSIILNYNTVLDLENKDTLFNKKQTLRISRYRNFVVLIISILFLYLNYRNKKIAKCKNRKWPYKLVSIVTQSLLLIRFEYNFLINS